MVKFPGSFTGIDDAVPIRVRPPGNSEKILTHICTISDLGLLHCTIRSFCNAGVSTAEFDDAQCLAGGDTGATNRFPEMKTLHNHVFQCTGRV